MKRILGIVSLAALMACRGTGPVEAPEAEIATVQDNLSQAMEAAGTAEKLVLVDVYSDT